MEVISEAGGLGVQPLRSYTKIMPNARFTAYLSKYKEVLNQIWSRDVVGATPWKIRLFYLIKY